MFAFDYVKIGMNNAKSSGVRATSQVLFSYSRKSVFMFKTFSKIGNIRVHTEQEAHTSQQKKRELAEQMEENKSQPQTTNRNLFFDWRYVRTLWDTVMVVLKGACGQ